MLFCWLHVPVGIDAEATVYDAVEKVREEETASEESDGKDDLQNGSEEEVQEGDGQQQREADVGLREQAIDSDMADHHKHMS
jgi:hypothetical protein